MSDWEPMTTEEMKGDWSLNFIPDRLRATVEDNARLRALIKDAEQGDGRQAVTTGFCPWCECSPGAHFRCPAFTPSGDVR